MTTTTTGDVADYLGKALAELAGASDADQAERQAIVERARATSDVAKAFTGIARAELDAVRLAEASGLVPAAVDVRPAPKQLD